ncbi:MAG: DUF2344 domain-containing protein [Anaerolineales bacterium]|nr:DUF2344 domain-containing protein [Anaerolineales bacterium]
MRVRITFAKDGALRYIGHLDLQHLWEWTLRRAGQALIYSQGFHPSPKIQIAAALPLGFSGQAEVVDVWLEADAAHLPSPDSLQSAAPPGLTVLAVEAVDERGPALQTRVEAAEYLVTLLEPVEASDLEERIAAVLAAESLPRERRGKPYDLRALIEMLETGTGTVPSAKHIRMRLAAREGATGRPEELLDVLGIPLEMVRVARTHLIFRKR